MDISTHILTKRMTTSKLTPTISGAFQLTSSRRGWPYTSIFNILIKYYFNSHPHEEDDFLGKTNKGNTNISTHILTKRMTESNYYVFKYWSISTHILTKRMTNFVELKNLVFDYFNSHPHEEDDCHNTLSPFLLYSYFNSHPHEEDDWIVCLFHSTY